MPIFEYVCENCKEVFDEIVKSAEEQVKCPKCRATARRSYAGKVYSSTGKNTGGCSGNCATCTSRCR